MKPSNHKKLTMKSSNAMLLLLGLWLLLSGAIHAEGGCPPGQIPHSGTDLSSCGPLPPGYGDNPQQPQPPQTQWTSQWGAIATDFAHSSAGASVNRASRSSAENAALAECRSNGGSTCKIETWYSNGCAAMIVGDKGHNSVNAATADEAIQKGMKICNNEDTKCHVYYSGCSLPQRIQ